MLKTERLRIYPASREQMEAMIASEQDGDEGRQHHPDRGGRRAGQPLLLVPDIGCTVDCDRAGVDSAMTVMFIISSCVIHCFVSSQAWSISAVMA